MLTTYFKHPFTLRKLRSGLAGPYLDDFASHLTQAGYCHNKIRAHLRGAGRFSAWTAQAGLTIDTLDLPALAQFRQCLDSQGLLRYRRGEYSNTFIGARHFVGFLQVSGIVSIPAPVVESELLATFFHWMHTQRGVTEITLNSYRPALRRLLDTLGDHPERYTAKQLREFVLDHIRGHKISQARTTVTVLRMFLRCLIAQGRCTSDLLLAIPSIAGWRGTFALLDLPPSVCRHYPRLYYYDCTVCAFLPMDSQHDYRARITPRPDRCTVLWRASLSPLGRHHHAAPGNLDGGHR